MPVIGSGAASWVAFNNLPHAAVSLAADSSIYSSSGHLVQHFAAHKC